MANVLVWIAAILMAILMALPIIALSAAIYFVIGYGASYILLYFGYHVPSLICALIIWLLHCLINLVKQ